MPNPNIAPPPLGNKRAVGNKGPDPFKYTEEFINGEAKALLEWCKKKDSYYVTAFSLERGYSVERLSAWAKKNSEFSKAYQIAKETQQVRLATGGLTNKTNPGFTKWMLACNHKWKEPPTEVINTTSKSGAEQYEEDMKREYAPKNEQETDSELG